ncbi:MAG: hypothetical protein DLM73_04665 [Chthoniobacterales bacterium]|nr:MAG: hypothetical protein DLM73_04665 [Chthoniobacterales bacterium]
MKIIRDLAVKQQNSAPQIFLSLRDAGRRFGVPTSVMAAIYTQLTKEGVLSSIRGSHTRLHGRGTARNLKVRALIGMPISISRFQALQDYRRCFLAIHGELHQRGFLTNTIFFKQPKGQPELVIAQLKKDKVDAVVWLLPDQADQDTALRLRDLGIQFVGVNIAPLSGIACRYQVQRQQAVRTIMRSWRKDPVIKSATIVRISSETPADEERLAKLRVLVESEKLKCEIATLREGRVSPFLKSLCTNKTGGVILPAAAAALLAWRAPEALTDVLRTCRIALIDGPMHLPFSERIPEAEVDLCTTEWSPVAKRIAEDLLTGEAFDDSEAIVFEARPYLRVLLSHYVERK